MFFWFFLDGDEPADVKIGLYSPQEQTLTLDGIKWEGKLFNSEFKDILGFQIPMHDSDAYYVRLCSCRI